MLGCVFSRLGDVPKTAGDIMDHFCAPFKGVNARAGERDDPLVSRISLESCATHTTACRAVC